MKKEIFLNGEKIEYELTYKKVKNLNLRIKPDGRVYVSVNRWTPLKAVEEFMQSKADFILKAIAQYSEEKKPLREFFSPAEIKEAVLERCRAVYPYFERLGVSYPEIRFRSMVSRWGSCNPSKKILSFNTKLMYAPPECVEYVVMHEFCHFLQANHSPLFYGELEKICPDWKRRRKILKEINIRRNT